MNDSIIEFIEHRSTACMMPMFDVYKFKPKGRGQRFQRLAWRFLNWCGAIEQAFESKITVTRHRIDSDNFLRCLLKQRHNLFDHFRKEGQRLLIGSEDYAELMCSPEMVGHHFQFCARVGMNEKIFGLNVEVIPWMRGAVVMP